MTLALLKVALLFALTEVAEIVGCYLSWLIIKQHKSIWLLIPAAFSPALTRWDAAGAFVALVGMAIIALQPTTNI